MPQKVEEFNFALGLEPAPGAKPAPSDDFNFDLGLEQGDMPADTRSTLAKGWDVATTPLVTPEQSQGVSAAIAGNRNGAPLSAISGGFLDAVSPTGLKEVISAFVKHPINTARAAVGGVVEGAAEHLTAPLDLAFAAAGPLAKGARKVVSATVPALRDLERAILSARASGNSGEVARLTAEIASARQSAGRAAAVSNGLRAAEGAAAVGMVARGAERALTGEDGGDTAAGIAQGLMGAAGLKMVAPKVSAAPVARTPALLPGTVRPSYVVTPEGVAGSPEAIGMRKAPDGSFVRGERAEYARHEIRGLLEAAPHRVTPDGVVVPPGSHVPDAPDFNFSGLQRDPSFVRAEPGEYARHEVRGLLPEQSASSRVFIATDTGRVGRRSEFDAGALDEAPAPPAAPVKAGKGKRAAGPPIHVPAAIADRRFEDGHEVNTIYSGDLSATDVPKVNMSAREQVEMRRLLAEMESMPFQSHTFNEVARGRGGDYEVVGGAAGAPVFHSITQGHSATRGSVIDAIRGMLEGRSSVMGQRALEEARNYIAGTGAGRRMLPDDAGVWEPQFRGDMGDEDFVGFSNYLDDQASIDPARRDRELGGEREPGEEGSINPLLLQHLGGAVAGGAVGGTIGDDTEARIRAGLAGAVLGGMAPSAVGRKPTARFRLKSSMGDDPSAGDPSADLDSRISGLAPASRPVQSPAVDASGRFLADSGAVNPVLAQHLGGAAAGAAAGATYGDTPREHLQGALAGAAAGAAVPRLARFTLKAPTVARIVGPGGTVGRVGGADGVSIPTTGRKAPAPEHPLRDPMAGVDVFLDKFAPEIRTGLRDVFERNGGFEAQRRGAIHQEQAERLAQGVLVDFQKRVKPGTTLNVEGIRAHTDALATAQAKVNDLAQRVARGQNTDLDVVALEAAKAEVSTLGASLMGARSEAGRALAQFRQLARVLDSGNQRLIAEAADTLRGEAGQFAQAFSQLPNDPMARFKWLQEQGRPGLREKVRQYYMANILSGVKSHERNILGNAANTLNSLMVHPVSAGLDAVKSRATGAPRQVYLDEFPSQIAGMVVGFERGISEALFSLRNGVNRSALTQSLSAAEAGKLDVPRVEFSGGGSNPFNWPGRALDGADQFFRAIAKNQEAHGMAHAQAKREGLKGEAFHDRMASLLAGEGEHGARIAEAADTFARRAVFQEKAGPLVGMMQAAAKRVPELSFVVPFMKTPANIFRQGFEFSPAGFAMGAVKQGGRAGTQAQARAAMGTAALGGLAYLAATGRLSGSGPQNPAERAQLMESGWRPNAIRIGDHWIEYSLFQPVSIPAAAVANVFEAWRAEGMKESDAVTKTAAAVKGFARSGLDQSFLSGVADLFEMVESQSLASASKYLGRQAHSLTPFAGAQRTVTQAMDPNVRAPEGFVETIQAAVPGLSSSVEPRLDRMGNEVVRPGGPLRRAADPFSVTPVSDDPVLAELGRLGVKMGAQTANMALPEGSRMTRAEDFDVRKIKGTAVGEVLAGIIELPRYQQLSDARKAAVLERAIASTRAAVTRNVKPTIRARIRAEVGQ